LFLDYPLAEPDEGAKYQIHCQEWKGMISSDPVGIILKQRRQFKNVLYR